MPLILNRKGFFKGDKKERERKEEIRSIWGKGGNTGFRTR